MSALYSHVRITELQAHCTDERMNTKENHTGYFVFARKFKMKLKFIIKTRMMKVFVRKLADNRRNTMGNKQTKCAAHCPLVEFVTGKSKEKCVPGTNHLVSEYKGLSRSKSREIFPINQGFDCRLERSSPITKILTGYKQSYILHRTDSSPSSFHY